MKTKFRYETPILVDLSAESAVGAICSAYGNYADIYMCQEGSCPAESHCATGTAAQSCYGLGTRACSAPSNENCLGCCQTGNSAGTPYPCACNQGMSATWQCDYGGNDGSGCGNGGNYPNCY